MTNSDLEREFYQNFDQVTVISRGVVIAPAANAAITSAFAPSAGMYELTVIARYGSVADILDNIDIRKNSGTVTIVPVLPVVNGVPIPITMNVRLANAETVNICATVAGAAGAVYIAQLFLTRIGD